MNARDVIAKAMQDTPADSIAFPSDLADVALSALTAAGLAIIDTRTHAAVPREASLGMLEAGHEAHAKKQTSGGSGMTIDAQIRAQCARVGAAWAAMVAAAEAEAKEAE